MKSRRMWAVLAVAIAAVVAIPAAVGASPHTKAGSALPLCTATGKIPMGNAGAISLKAKGKGSAGTPVTCAATVKGKWAKNSQTFSIDAIGTSKVGKGGTFTLDPKTNLKPFTGKVTGLIGNGGAGGATTGTAIWVEIHCYFSYPPLKLGCEVIIHTGPPPTGAPHRSVRAAAPMKTTSTPLCTATGSKPLGNTGVVALSAKGKGTSGTGTPTSCTARLTGKWAKNSTQFSFDTTGKGTLGKGGAWTLARGTALTPLAGTLKGTLTGSGLPTGSALTIEIKCWLSYPPLKAGCQIIISSL